MDTIFHKTTSIFNLVKTAKNEPRRYGENGELLINYDETEEHREAERRRSSITSGVGGRARKGSAKGVENVERSRQDEGYRVE